MRQTKSYGNILTQNNKHYNDTFFNILFMSNPRVGNQIPSVFSLTRFVQATKHASSGRA
jgi:hypothetical protein